MSEHDDRRAHRRVDREVNISVTGSASTFAVTTRDISEGGVFFFTRQAFPLNALLQLELQAGEDTIKADAIVVHHLKGVGVGVQFEALSDESRTSLRSLIAAA